MCRVVIVVYVCCVMGAFAGRGKDRLGSPGVPLLLTPLLEHNKVAEAQRLARVTPNIGNMTSFSGYFTIDKNCSSNSFFWFFPAQKNWKQAPVMLWLQGGPGISSMTSVFLEMGPLTYDGQIGSRQYSWNVENNLLFIDQPIGTGYSFTEKGCYAQNEEDVSRDLYSGVVQFFQLFPELKPNKFYITGQSYAGHFIPALGYAIHKNNPTARVKINLAGLMIGNGWMDAVDQNDIGSYLYQHGLIDDEGRNIYQSKQDQFVQFMKNKEYQKALEIRGDLVGETYTKYVGNVSILNYLEGIGEFNNPYESYIQLPEIRKALHVGNTNFSIENQVVATSLGVDPVISVKPWVEQLLEHYPIVFYTGQLDIICSYPTVVSFLKALNWSSKAQFQAAPRQKWCVGDEQAGYFKGAHNLYDVMVRKAAHSVPFSQPFWSYILANSVGSSPTTNPLQRLTPCK